MRPAGFNLAEIVGGVAIIALGAFVVFEASGYPIGQLRRMGPGYLPVVLGSVLILLGLLVILEGRAARTTIPAVPWRALLAISAGIVAFGVLVRPLGLVPAVVALVLIASLAEERLRLGTALVLALGLAAFAWIVFVSLLGLSMRPFWWR
jgi:hypothetical protein